MNYLDTDDEFFQVDFAQASTDDETGKTKLIELKAVTYALLSWWKDGGNDDIIDVADDGESALLQFDSGLQLEGSEETCKVRCIFETDENQMELVLYLYPATPGWIPADRVASLVEAMVNLNGKISFGSLELTQSKDGYFLRYKAATCMKGVRVGKYAMVQSLFQHGMANLNFALDQLQS